jgi:hypothetical protein
MHAFVRHTVLKNDANNSSGDVWLAVASDRPPALIFHRSIAADGAGSEASCISYGILQDSALLYKQAVGLDTDAGAVIGSANCRSRIHRQQGGRRTTPAVPLSCSRLLLDRCMPLYYTLSQHCANNRTGNVWLEVLSDRPPAGPYLFIAASQQLVLE